MGTYSWYVGTLIDGLIVSQLPVSSSSWSVVLDDADGMTATVPLADPTVAALRPYLIAEPCRTFLAVSYIDGAGVETFLAAGPIWSHSYDDVTRELTLGAAGLWSYFDHRKVLNFFNVGDVVAGSSIEFSGMSLGTVASRLVAQTGLYAPSLLGVIVLPPDLAGTADLFYLGNDLSVTGEMLRNLTLVENGPEIRFLPRRKASDPRYLEWLMAVGTTTQPLLVQAGADWLFDASAPASPVVSVSVLRDGSGVASRVWAKGADTGAGPLIVRADDASLLNIGYPLLEVEETGHDSVTDSATLKAWARSALLRAHSPIETWSVGVRRDEDPTVGQYLPGHWCSFVIGPDSPYLPPGTYRTRITAVAGDDGGVVTLQLAPTIGSTSTSGYVT